ncbi:hypothetical protein [Pseudomonas sp. EYE_354]|uniref:hypothetical protein n=1 Tax=Pseudomonas sp. EYE_354 TaxID=2853449 RepID=UPI0020065406|nr:hypothetical protein [Pseudomonas sp. EYE_354]
MDATYKQLIEHLFVIGQHCAKPRLKRLEVFIRDIHFQPAPDDDYYKRVLK